MYLKRMELYGFKSFADRTELEFSRGITAIVGPNGSGKSNLSDAIRWVLGEQSARILRGSRMEDVIFVGSSTRKPLGFAEATLVFDNTDGQLPVDFPEVAVTRRVYRSGESEFLICGTPCRLRDLQALFMDTGVGKEGYSVVEQGRIEAILAAGSDERRAFFEEAAGIQKYKTRRADTERRLTLADGNMARVRDVLAELSRQMEPLAKKADAARRFAGYRQELAALETGLALASLAALEKRRASLARRIAEVNTRLDESVGLRESLTSTLATDKVELARLDDERDRVQAEAAELAARVEKAEGRIALAQERVASQVNQAKALEGAVERDRERLAALASELAAKKARLTEIGSELELAEADLHAREADDESLQERYRVDKEVEERLKVDIIEVLSEIADVKNELARMALEDESDARRLERQKREMEAALADLAELEGLIANEESRRSELAARMSLVAREINELEPRIEAARRSLKELIARDEGLIARIRERSLELEAYERLASENEWYPHGARAVLAGARQGTLEGILGPIGSAIRVPRELDRAIEAALGQAISDIIVVRDAHARAAVRYLKERNLGRATFLPLDLIRPSSLGQEERRTLTAAGVLGVASELVSCDPGIRKALDYLLGRTVVVRDLDVAVGLSRASGTRFKVVTCDGEIIFPGGAISGGSHRIRSREGPLSLRRRLEDASRDLERLRDDRARSRTAIEAARGNIADMEKRYGELRSEKQALDVEAAKVEAREAQAQRDLERARSRVQVLEGELGVEAAASGSRDGARKELELRYARLLSTSRELTETQAETAARLSETARKRDDLARAITDIKVKVASLTQQASGLRERIAALDILRDDLVVEIDAKEKELARATEALQSAGEDILGVEAELGSLRIEKAKLEESLARVKEQRRELGRRVAQAESKLRLCQGDIEDLQKAKESCSVEEAGLAERAKHIEEELFRTHSLTLEEARKRAADIPDPEEAEQKVKSLRSEMEALGPVDPGVLEVYESLTSRYGQLAAGLDDLCRARRVVEEVMDRADRESESRFRETFDAVRYEFARMFARLFGGGRADLVMVGGDGSLVPGVDIIAEPPGKKLQSLTLLSAGEKALAATALVFAILEVRPSPFCVLDEIDAALDEANVARFVELLKDAAAQGQLIVVTHRKGTMEAADVLYGVTMEESGVSKLISVNLEDMAYSRQQTA